MMQRESLLQKQELTPPDKKSTLEQGSYIKMIQKPISFKQQLQTDKEKPCLAVEYDQQGEIHKRVYARINGEFFLYFIQ